MINDIINLSNKLKANWDKTNFPKKSKMELLNFNYNKTLKDFENEVKDFLKTNPLPPQLNLYNNFGEPSLTLFNNGSFAIDVYFWRKNDTLIHSHGFRGAFIVLFGKSLHEEFDVKVIDQVTGDIQKTEIKINDSKVMLAGDVQIINSDLTHRVVHLSHPTVTLCLRTIEDTELSQWHHLSSGMSFKKFHPSEKIIKQILYAQYLFHSDPVTANNFVNDILADLDKSIIISLYESLCYNEFGLDEMYSEQIELLFENYMQKESWFKAYKTHYLSQSKNLQEFNASSESTKLATHCINNNYSKEQLAKSLSKVSKTSLNQVHKNLISESDIYLHELRDQQIETIKNYFKK